MEGGAAAAASEPQAPVGPQEFNHTFPKGALGMSIGIKADQVVVRNRSIPSVFQVPFRVREIPSGID